MTESEQPLLVFGYGTKIFGDDEKALFLHKGHHLIPWIGDQKILIDRYDCRGYLSELPINSSSNEDFDNQIEVLCDEERYCSMGNDPYEDEIQKLHQEIASDASKYSSIGYTYEDSASTEQSTNEIEDLFVPPENLPIPPNMEIDQLELFKDTLEVQMPSSVKQNSIIEMTAEFVLRQGPQMEIVMKTRQNKNPLFKFMNHDDMLYPYYRHMMQLIKEKLYHPIKPLPKKKEEKDTLGSESDNLTDENDSDDDGYLHPSLFKNQAPPKSENLVEKAVQDIKAIRERELERQEAQRKEFEKRQKEMLDKIILSSRTGDDPYSKLVSQIQQQNAQFKKVNINDEETGSEDEEDDFTLYPDTSDIEDALPPESKLDGKCKKHLIRKRKKRYCASSEKMDALIERVSFIEAYARYLEEKPCFIQEQSKIAIIKLVEYVIRNGPAFEQEIAAKNTDNRFAFLVNPAHVFYPYYVFELKRLFEHITNAYSTMYDNMYAVFGAGDISTNTKQNDSQTENFIEGNNQNNENTNQKDNQSKGGQIIEDNSLYKVDGELIIPGVEFKRTDLTHKENLCWRLHFKQVLVEARRKKKIKADKAEADKGLLKLKDNKLIHDPVCFSIKARKEDKTLPFSQVTMLLYEDEESPASNGVSSNNSDDNNNIDGSEKRNNPPETHSNPPVKYLNLENEPITNVIQEPQINSTAMDDNPDVSKKSTLNGKTSNVMEFDLIIHNKNSKSNYTICENHISELPSSSHTDIDTTHKTVVARPHISDKKKKYTDGNTDLSLRVKAERKKKAALFVKMLLKQKESDGEKQNTTTHSKEINNNYSSLTNANRTENLEVKTVTNQTITKDDMFEDTFNPSNSIQEVEKTPPKILNQENLDGEPLSIELKGDFLIHEPSGEQYNNINADLEDGEIDDSPPSTSHKKRLKKM